ncbi:MAG: adenylyl-sulfate kinase [Deltaproteobacteria bacterium]|nr:adenylyl-sulfate kinase [Deltaproteobacteria bacterium]
MALERASNVSNVTWHSGHLTRDERWAALGRRGATLWFTGLSGSGKSVISAALEQTLLHRGVSAYRLDGDNLRFGLNQDLGFSRADRDENVRRAGEVAKLFADSGTVALVGAISPYAAQRDLVRAMHTAAGVPYFEVFVDTPLEVCEARDVKGLYKKARAGEITGFTGIDDPYERPAHPSLTLRAGADDIPTCVGACLALLEAEGVIEGTA